MNRISINKLLQILIVGGFILLAPRTLFAQSEPVEEVIVDSTVFRFEDQPGATVDTAIPGNEGTVENTSYYKPAVPDTASLREVPAPTIDSFKKSRDFEYANDPAYWVKKKEEEKVARRGFFEWLFSSNLVRWIMYVLLGLTILFVIYRIIVNNNLFYNSSKKTNVANDEEDDVQEYDNIDEKIRLSIAEKDFRKAVRFLYVKTLQRLDQRGWIRFHSQATNHEYVSQMSKHSLSGDFNFLTQVYEYVWYGEFKLTENQFGIVESNFNKLLKAAG